MELKLYVVKRPDGTLIHMLPQESVNNALAVVPDYERERRPTTSDQLRAGVSPEARCWRAHGSYNWAPRLAVEIVSLMGYAAVEVKVVESSAPTGKGALG